MVLILSRTGDPQVIVDLGVTEDYQEQREHIYLLKWDDRLDFGGN